MDLLFSQIPQFSLFDRAFAEKNSVLEPFWSVYPYPLEGYAKVMEARYVSPEQRSVLADVLWEQHAGILPHLPERVADGLAERIGALRRENVFTVTCAHQPCLLTGPLYVVYKILSTVRLSEELSKKFPDRQFVPVYWNGGEDHDFEEANHLHLFGKKIVWKDRQNGPVSRYSIDSLAEVWEGVRRMLGDSENAAEIVRLVELALRDARDYGEFNNRLIVLLFGRFGLLALDPMDARLKALAKGLFAEELREKPSRAIVLDTQARLEKAGFRPQAHAREINLFYLGKNLRERDRIVAEGECYGVHGTGLRFSESELMHELDAHPERFGPNVVLRPLYQETVLPNVAFVGGGGELAYWLERKALFEHFGLDMPVTVRRDSFLLVEENLRKKWEKWGLSAEDLFAAEARAVEKYLARWGCGETDMDQDKKALGTVFDGLREKASAIDPTLVGAVEAERTKALKSLEQLEARLRKADRARHDNGLSQLRGVLSKLFPDGKLQERHDHFFPFFLKKGHAFFDDLLSDCAPWEPRLHVR